MLATRNPHKMREIREILFTTALPIRILDLPPELLTAEETGKSYRENAVQKAVCAAQGTGKVALADDSGLEVDALDGHPGIFSSRFAGKGVTDQENRKKLLSLLHGLPEEKRGARFICTIAVATPHGEVEVVEGRCEGWIGWEERGENGFGYDPVFMVLGYTKSLAELSPSEKNRISHRALALIKGEDIIRRILGA